MDSLTYDYDSELKFTLEIGLCNASRETTIKIEDYFDKEDWDTLSEERKEDEILEILKEWSEEYISRSFKKIQK